VKIFLGILSSILSTWPSQLIRCPFIHFTMNIHIQCTFNFPFKNSNLFSVISI
jgi:hypothetical protein